MTQSFCVVRESFEGVGVSTLSSKYVDKLLLARSAKCSISLIEPPRTKHRPPI